MKVGLFFDLRNPPPWQRPWAEHYRHSLEIAVEADRAGIDAIWLSEHHFFEDGYLPQPFTYAAAVAAVTSRVRIGTAIVVAALRHPVHLAEQAAVVDLISGGRLEVGIGAGWSVPEYETFGADIRRRYSLTDAAIAEVGRLLVDGGVTPPPLQQPPPLWAGYQGPQGAGRAGRLGVGLLSLNRALHGPYVEALVAAGHDPASARMGGVVDIILADDPEAALPQILPHYAYQQNTYRRARTEGTGKPAPSELTVEGLLERRRPDGSVAGLSVLTAQRAVEVIGEQTAGLPVEHVYLWATIAGMPEHLAARHRELVAGVLRPALADR